jgi:hypothetical protein
MFTLVTSSGIARIGEWHVEDLDLTAVEIRPGVGTLGMFKYMDYTPWHAIGEFVDNSVTSWQATKDRILRLDHSSTKLLVSITLDPTDGGELRIYDNAGGIAAADYVRAFKPAERPADQSHLSRYGMGMKTAACWFSDKWRVASKALGENVERTVEFDIPKFVQDGVERITPIVHDAKTNEHWTELVLWELNQIPVKKTVGKIRDHLCQMYRRFLRSGEVEIVWNEQPLTYRDRSVLVAPHFKDGDAGEKRRWVKDLSLSLPQGEHVLGRAMLFEKGEQKAAGLHLFWRGRMIKGNLEDFYRPQEIFQFAGSFRVQRLLVELDLDEFSPTVDKKDFIWGRGNSSEQDMLAALRKQLNAAPLPMLDQADNYRSGKVDKPAREAAERAAKETADAVLELGEEQINEQAGRTVPADDLLPRQSRLTEGSMVELDLTVQGDPWHVTIELSERRQDRTHWLEITERPAIKPRAARRLAIRLSLNHPFTMKFAADPRSMALIVRLATGLAIAELTTREAGGKNAGAVRRNLNELLLNVLTDS